MNNSEASIRRQSGRTGSKTDRMRPSALPAKAPVPDMVWMGTLVLAVWGMFTANPALTLGSVLLLPLLFKLLWRQGEAPLLLFGCVFQWLQVVIPVIIANYYSQTLEVHFGTPLRTEATWLGLVGLAVFALGLRLALRGCARSIGPAVEKEVAAFNINRLFLAWFFSLLLSIPVEILCRMFPGITQVVGQVLGVKAGLVFLLGYVVVRQQRGYGTFVFVVAAEFLMGTMGYFSGFKIVLNVLLLILLTVARLGNLRTWMFYLVLAATMIVCGSVWTAVKPEYRNFLNQGSGQQVVTVPVAQRMDYLCTHLKSIDKAMFSEGFETLLTRIGYTEFFAQTLNHVPKAEPYGYGRLWLEAVTRVLTPRIFFPAKEMVDDSKRTRKYAGVDVAGADEGASIGLGYMAESYVDFGAYFMFLPIFLMALLLGLVYRYFVLRPRMGAWGYVIAIAMPYSMPHMFETSNIKLVGQLISCVILFVPLNHYYGQSIKAWLRGGDGTVQFSKPSHRGR